jgi:hypothetical protein
MPSILLGAQQLLNQLAARVFTKFRILEISYISYVFFYFVYIRKWQQFREINRNFTLTRVRIDSYRYINSASLKL